jgi:hypothetical protein
VQILSGLGKKSIIFGKGKAGGWTAFPEEGFNGRQYYAPRYGKT